MADVTFAVALDADGHVQRITQLSDPEAFSARQMAHRLREHHAAVCQDAHWSQEAVTFDVHFPGTTPTRIWALTLVPAETESGAPPRLVGAARDVTASRQNRATLRERAAIQQRLVELLPDAIIITDTNDQLLFVNSAAVDMLGAESEDELLGTSLWEFVHPASQSHVREHKRQLHRGKPLGAMEHTLVRLDGRTIPIETASVPIMYQSQRAALITARDLTGRKSMAEALSRTLDLFDKAFHSGPAALLIARMSDGVVLEASDRMAELTGYQTHELVGRDVRQLEVWTDACTQDQLTQQLVEGGTIREAEFPIRRKDGTIRTLLGSAHQVEMRGTTCVLASAIDITERREAATAEQESRALLHKIFHFSPAAIGILCADTDTFLDVNQAFADLVGYEPDTLTQRSLDVLDLWRDPDQFRTVRAALQEGGPVYDQEVTLHTADGTGVTTLSSFQQIQVEGRACILMVMTDITARKEAEDALRQAKDQAEEIAQFRSALLQNMTHEIRTPLTVILGFTSMLHQGIRDDYRRFVDLIERSGRRLLLTLDSLLDLAQLESGTLQVDNELHNVFDIVHGTAASLEPMADQKGLTFSLDLPATAAYARFDCELFSHALTHLIDNAIKFTEEGEVAVTAEVADDAVRVHVKDTGVGVGEQFEGRLFDAFSQESEGISRTHQGSGLGLTVAHRLVDRIGGRIEHASRKGQGSVFTIELPVASTEKPHPTEA
jgi:PAS domain S-box-containing protein